MLKSTLTTYLDLGDLGSETPATIGFDYYIAPIQREDDYNELTINEVWIELAGTKIDVVDLLSAEVLNELEEACWDELEFEHEPF